MLRVKSGRGGRHPQIVEHWLKPWLNQISARRIVIRELNPFKRFNIVQPSGRIVFLLLKEKTLYTHRHVLRISTMQYFSLDWYQNHFYFIKS